MKRIILVLLTLLSFCINAYPESFKSVSTLKTTHFIVNFNTGETSYAARIADLAEEHYGKIETFLNYSIDKPITITASDSKLKFFVSSFSRALHVSSDGNFTVVSEELYRGIFLFFWSNLKNESTRFFSNQTGERLLCQSLCNYSLKGFNLNEEMIVRSFLQQSGSSGIQISEIINHNETVSSAFLSGLFNFLESEYSSRTMIRIVKESFYYGNFINSLSAVTGDKIDDISKKYTSFLVLKLKKYGSDFKDYSLIDNSIDHWLIIDFAISPDGDSIAVLKKNEAGYSVEKLNIELNKSSIVVRLDRGVSFNSICFRGDNSIAVSGNSSNKSSIIILHSETLQKEKEFNIPFIFSNSIAAGTDNSFFLNSRYGSSAGIIIFDAKEGGLKKVFAESALPETDIVSDDKNVYYISKKEFFEIVKLSSNDYTSGSVIKFNDQISSMKIYKNQLTVSINNSSGAAIFLYDSLSNTFIRKLSLDFPVYRAIIKDDTLYYLTFLNNKQTIIKESIHY